MLAIGINNEHGVNFSRTIPEPYFPSIEAQDIADFLSNECKITEIDTILIVKSDKVIKILNAGEHYKL